MKHYNEIHSLMEEIIEECPEHIIRASGHARATGDELPNICVKFSSRAEMTGMAEWLSAKMREWWLKKSGKQAVFTIEEGLFDREIAIKGQDLSDLIGEKKGKG